MIIDLVFLLLLALAAFKGYRKGLIIAAASFAGYFIGLAAAMKLSAAVAAKLAPANPWIPFFSFLLVFIITAWLVSLLGRTLHKGADMIMAGPLNRAGGMLVYLFTYALIISLFLFFLLHIGWLPEKTVSESRSARHLEPLGRNAFESLGHWIPLFRDMFSELLDFFEGINNELKQP